MKVIKALRTSGTPYFLGFAYKNGEFRVGLIWWQIVCFKSLGKVNEK